MVAEAGAAVGPQLLDEAGRVEAAGRQGGVGQPLLRVVHQLVGGGALQRKNKVFFILGGCGDAILDSPSSSSSSRARRAPAGSQPG